MRIMHAYGTCATICFETKSKKYIVENFVLIKALLQTRPKGINCFVRGFCIQEA